MFCSSAPAVGSVGNRKGAQEVYLLQIEHRIRDFDTWKGAFDRFSGLRQQSGARRHRVLRPLTIQTTSSSTSSSTALARRKLFSLHCGATCGHRAKHSASPEWRAADARGGGGGGQGVLTPGFFLKSYGWSASLLPSTLIHDCVKHAE